MVGTEITLPKGRMTQKITRQRDRRIGQLKVGTKITRQRDGWHKNNSPMDGQMES